MIEVTLDMNCLIALEKGEPEAPYIKKMIEMCKDRQINLRVVAISASEKNPNGTYASHFDEFKERIDAIGLGEAKVLNTIARAGMCYTGYCVFAGGDLSDLEREIQEVLFPTVETEYREYCRKRGLDLDDKNAWQKWANAKCDVLALWSHIWNGGGVFVTSDSEFHKKTKKDRLIALGAGEILKPQEAVHRISQLIRTRA